MSVDKKNINDLIALIERNKIATGQTDSWYNTGAINISEEDEEDDDDEDEEEDFSKVRLLIFAADGPFTQSLLPMLDQHDLAYTVTDEPEKTIDIAMNNPHIRHVLIDLDKPTNPAKATNIFSDLRTLNPGIVIYYCTKNPMSMESRNIQTKGAKLLQKPILRKALETFVVENFRN